MTSKSSKKYDFHMELDNAAQFIDCFKMLQNAGIETCYIDLGMDDMAIHILAIHSARVGIFQLVIHKNAVDAIDVVNPVTIAIRVSDFLLLVNVINRTDALTVYLESGNRDVLKMEFKSVNVKSKTKLDVKLLTTLDEQRSGIPDISPGCTIVMSSKHFSRLIKSLDKINDSINLKLIYPDTFEISTDGAAGKIHTSLSGVQSDVKVTEEILTHASNGNNNDEDFTGDFEPQIIYDQEAAGGMASFDLTLSTKILIQYIKADTMAPLVKLCCTPGQPLVLEYRLFKKSDKSVEFARFTLHQCPMYVDEDEDDNKKQNYNDDAGADEDNPGNGGMEPGDVNNNDEDEEPQDYDMDI